MRITYPGDGKGGFKRDEAVDKYSVVTLVNDTEPGSPTTSWPDKPKSIDHAQKTINGKDKTGKPWLSDGKYRQIVESANALEDLEKDD